MDVIGSDQTEGVGLKGRPKAARSVSIFWHAMVWGPRSRKKGQEKVRLKRI